MGKPRLLILIRHAQSEGNKNREIHQTVPDHRVKLTAEGHRQALEAGRRLRAMLRPDDTLHFFTSPYRRTRETTEGILASLTADDPSPSPFPRNTIKVYEEPRLREQDFGNFQPCSAAMERMWQERADYGHFFYRIPSGESAADAYDRVSGFNESLWRLFGEDDFASVCVLVTHGLMTRIFLMKWYHFSVEYFEDLRNINHCEFVVMKKDDDNGKYILQNNLRTWSELQLQRDLEKQKEKAAREAAFGTDIASASSVASASPVLTRRRWGGCPDGCNHGLRSYKKKIPLLQKQTSQPASASAAQDTTAPYPEPINFTTTTKPSPTTTPESELTRGLAILHLGGGRDAGGSRSGATSRASFTSSTTTSSSIPHHHHPHHLDDDDDDDQNAPVSPPTSGGSRSLTSNSDGGRHPDQTPRPRSILAFGGGGKQGHAHADSLGDTDESDDAAVVSDDEEGDERRVGSGGGGGGSGESGSAVSGSRRREGEKEKEEALDVIKAREQSFEEGVY
ncbi:hypothetical protein LOZ58_000475 [Ophidiomyces ophidiicola]|nr:hypothetical protein LOZ58_000475 [Ophidiomyces ophidiicola]